MGLQTEEITRNIESISNTTDRLTANGVTFNFSADRSTINGFGSYMIIASLVLGVVIPVVQYLVRKILG